MASSAFEALLETDFVIDFENTFQVSYKDTRITLTKAVLESFLSLTLSMFLFAAVFLKSKRLGIFKEIYAPAPLQ